MVVLGDAVDGPDGHLKLSGSKVEPHHPLGQQGQPLAELHHPLAPQGGEHHPLAGHFPSLDLWNDSCCEWPWEETETEQR